MDQSWVIERLQFGQTQQPYGPLVDIIFCPKRTLDILVAIFVAQSDQIVQAAIRNAFDINVNRTIRQLKVRRPEHVDTILLDRECLEGRLVFRARAGGARGVPPWTIGVGKLVDGEDTLLVLPLALLLLHGGEEAEVVLLDRDSAA